MIVKPKQKRSIATKNKIKKVARQLFAERGYYEVTSNVIAKEAGVPIGSFYNYFGNKKGVLLELIREFNEALYEAINFKEDLLFEGIDTREKAFQQMESGLTDMLLSPNLSDPFYSVFHALQFTEPDVLALSEEYRAIEINKIKKFLEKVNEFQPIKNIPVTAKLIHASGENVALYLHHLGTTLEKEVLIAETIRMFYGYLFLKK